MKIVIGNYSDPEDNRNLILNSEVKDYSTGSQISPLMALISSISGLETPPYRNGTGDWSGADGGYLGTQLYGAREIVISGAYIDKMANCDYSSTSSDQFSHVARMYIRSRLPIRVKQIIRIFLDNGMTFFTEGYCTDLKMEYTYVGHGDYQITMFCPDPALYRGATNGGLNSEWNIATLFKAQDVGYKSSWIKLNPGVGEFNNKGHVASVSELPSDAEANDAYTVGEDKPYNLYIYDGSDWTESGQVKYALMSQGSDGVQSFIPNHHYTTSDTIVYGAIPEERHLYVPKTDFTSGEAFDERDWNEQPEFGTNHGYVWTTGGRSTAVQYTGDFPYYPQLIVELKDGEHCVNPSFYSVNEDKTFSLGYPETKVATFRVVDIDNDDKEHGRGAITEIEIIEGGSYDADYSGRKIQMQNYSSERKQGNTGYGCFLNLTAEKTEDGTWEFVDAEINDGGDDFSVGDTITPLIAGAAIFQLASGQKLVIDMAEHTVMVYSGSNSDHRESYSYYITAGSEWFQLDPLSTNNIIFSSANAGDVDVATIQWRNGYAGI